MPAVVLELPAPIPSAATPGQAAPRLPVGAIPAANNIVPFARGIPGGQGQSLPVTAEPLPSGKPVPISAPIRPFTPLYTPQNPVDYAGNPQSPPIGEDTAPPIPFAPLYTPQNPRDYTPTAFDNALNAIPDRLAASLAQLGVKLADGFNNLVRYLQPKQGKPPQPTEPEYIPRFTGGQLPILYSIRYSLKVEGYAPFVGDYNRTEQNTFQAMGPIASLRYNLTVQEQKQLGAGSVGLALLHGQPLAWEVIDVRDFGAGGGGTRFYSDPTIDSCTPVNGQQDSGVAPRLPGDLSLKPPFSVAAPVIAPDIVVPDFIPSTLPPGLPEPDYPSAPDIPDFIPSTLPPGLPEPEYPEPPEPEPEPEPETPEPPPTTEPEPAPPKPEPAPDYPQQTPEQTPAPQIPASEPDEPERRPGTPQIDVPPGTPFRSPFAPPEIPPAFPLQPTPQPPLLPGQTPAPLPGQTPETTPAPAPQPSPSPQPAPLPGQTPAPLPAPLPGQTPQTTPAPAPQPTPTPQPAPLPGQTPAPLPQTTPAPQPSPSPQPAPLPGQTPNQNPSQSPGNTPFNLPAPQMPANLPAPQTVPQPLTPENLPAPQIPPQTQTPPQTPPNIPTPGNTPTNHPPYPQPSPPPPPPDCPPGCSPTMPTEPCRYQPPNFVSINVRVFKACKTGSSSPLDPILDAITGNTEFAEFEQKIVHCLKGEEDKTTLLFERLATTEALQCNPTDAIAAVPEWWQVRIGADRPQLVVLYAELKEGKLGRSRYAMTLPHYNKPQSFKPTFPSYKKGQWEGLLTLADNSKLIINAANPAVATGVINALKPFINPTLLVGSFIKIGERKGQALLQINVVPVSARFFSTGQKDTNPDWVKDLRK